MENTSVGIPTLSALLPQPSLGLSPAQAVVRGKVGGSRRIDTPFPEGLLSLVRRVGIRKDERITMCLL